MSELIAYHESGHALMAFLLGGEVRSVTIEPDNDDGPDRQGDTQVLWRRSRMTDKKFAETAIQVSLYWFNVKWNSLCFEEASRNPWSGLKAMVGVAWVYVWIFRIGAKAARYGQRRAAQAARRRRFSPWAGARVASPQSPILRPGHPAA